MNIALREYGEADRENMVAQLADFFGFHAALVNVCAENDISSAAETLNGWLEPGHELRVITLDGESAGFVHIGYRGGNVAWIEDIYVAPQFRGQGVATRAIALAERLIAQKPGYDAVCMDVAPRNEAALRLYHRLGYDSLSLVTLRKQLGENPRDRHAEILGLDFKY